jgi:hypothetical protein
MNRQNGGPPPEPKGSVIELSEHTRRRVYLCPGRGNELVGVALVPIADVIDEKRLSSMAAHPSMWRPRSPQPVQDPMGGEEFD